MHTVIILLMLLVIEISSQIIIAGRSISCLNILQTLGGCIYDEIFMNSGVEGVFIPFIIFPWVFVIFFL